MLIVLLTLALLLVAGYPLYSPLIPRNLWSVHDALEAHLDDNERGMQRLSDLARHAEEARAQGNDLAVKSAAWELLTAVRRAQRAEHDVSARQARLDWLLAERDPRRRARDKAAVARLAAGVALIGLAGGVAFLLEGSLYWLIAPALALPGAGHLLYVAIEHGRPFPDTDHAVDNLVTSRDEATRDRVDAEASVDTALERLTDTQRASALQHDREDDRR